MSKNEINTLKKIVYFDEGSATDFIQIVNGGKLEKTTNLINETNKQFEANAEASASVPLSSLLSSIFKIGGSLTGEYKKKNSQMGNSIISNTILTDFVSIANSNEYKNQIDSE